MESPFIIFETDLDFPDFCSEADLCGFINESVNNLNMPQNYMLLIFKLCVYQSRERRVLNINNVIKNVTKLKKLKRKIAFAFKKKPFSLIINRNQ